MKKIFMILLAILLLSYSSYAAPTISVNPTTVEFTVIPDGTDTIFAFDETIQIGNAELDTIDISVTYGYFDEYGTDNETEVYLLNSYVQGLGAEDFYAIDNLTFPVETNLSGIYFLFLTFETAGGNVEITVDNYYNLTVESEEPPEEPPEESATGQFEDLNNNISGLFGILSTVISEVVVLMTGPIVILVTIGAFITLIVGIIYALRSQISRYLKIGKFK